MKINVHTRNAGPQFKPANRQTQIDSIETRIERALKHVVSQVDQVDFHLEDETPGSQKYDGRCRITVYLTKGDPISVEGHGDSFPETLADGVRKIQSAVENACRKKLDRKRRLNQAAT